MPLVVTVTDADDNRVPDALVTSRHSRAGLADSSRLALAAPAATTTASHTGVPFRSRPPAAELRSLAPSFTANRAGLLIGSPALLGRLWVDCQAWHLQPDARAFLHV